MIAGSDPPPSGEQTFADVLNALTFGGRPSGGRRGRGRRAARSEPAQDADRTPPLVSLPDLPPVPDATAAATLAAASTASTASTAGTAGTASTAGAAGTIDATAIADGPDQPVEPVEPPEPAEVIEVAAIVRPYAWTRGRTRSTIELQVETLVSAAEPLGASAPPEHRTIAELCHTPHSVAEVAALLDVPLGVAKVLISDMAEVGLLTVHRTAITGGPQAHLMLMERVLSGLRRL